MRRVFDPTNRTRLLLVLLLLEIGLITVYFAQLPTRPTKAVDFLRAFREAREDSRYELGKLIKEQNLVIGMSTSELREALGDFSKVRPYSFYLGSPGGFMSFPRYLDVEFDSYPERRVFSVSIYVE